MLFNSFSFAGFLAVVVCVLFLLHGATPRLVALILASYAFYGFAEVRCVPLLMAYTALGWFAGNWIHRTRDERLRRVVLTGSVGLSLAGLAFFKYMDFVASSAAALLGLRVGPFGILLPIGISFYTFEVISYLVDIHRRSGEPPRVFLHFALFMAFFPRLVAGPIIRASDFLPQVVHHMAFERQNVIAGARMFLVGMLLKVLFADNLSVFVDAVYTDVSIYSARTLLFTAVCYSLQIYGDFAGYSLMGIGLARSLGFWLPPNFNMPYLATSIADFWHRWHISLSTWLRDYLYIPLGGSRRGEARTLAGLMITMGLGGLWHGASWNFVIWGLLHGLLLVVHRLWSRSAAGLASGRQLGLAYTGLGWFTTFILVTALWVPFRSPDFASTRIFWARVLTGAEGIEWIHTPSLTIVLSMAAWHVWIIARPQLRWRESLTLVPARAGFMPAFLAAGAAVLLLLMFGQQNASPFIYFQF